MPQDIAQHKNLEEEKHGKPHQETPAPKKTFDESTSIPPGHHEVKTLLSWTAPGRPFRKRGREYFLNIIIITALVTVILLLFREYMLILLVGAFVFVSYALNAIAPHDFHYQITTEEARIEDHVFFWPELYDFYFKRIQGAEVLHVRTRSFYPGELTLVLGEMHKEHIKTVLLPYLPFREYIKPTFMDKSGDWLAKTFPLEKTKPQV